MKTDVLIVGAGPSGLMLANQLFLRKVSFILIDSKLGPTKESRALAVSGRSMEIYRQLQLSENILQNSSEVSGFDFYNNGKTRASINMQEVGTGISDFTQMMTIFEQSKNEELLFENLKDAGPIIYWNTTFLQMKEEENTILSTVEGKDGEFQIESKYLIGCDGASSRVRHQLDFSFDGGTYENRFYVADVLLDSQIKKHRITLAPAKYIFTAFFPLEGNDKMRLVGTLPDEFNDQQGIDFTDIESSVLETSKLSFKVKEVNWFSTYKLHHRCVNTFSIGRTFLVGDSAHIHSPAGGQGMNTGLIDAHNLAWKLAMVLKGKAKKELLDTYNEERLPFAKWLLNFTDRGFNLLSNKSWRFIIFRMTIFSRLMPLAMKFERVRKRAYKVVSQIWYSYSGYSLTTNKSNQKLTCKAGDRLPNLVPGLTKMQDSYDFYLFSFSENAEAPNIALTKFPFKVIHKHIPIDDEAKQSGIKQDLIMFVRPDQHICFVSDGFELDALLQHLRKYFLL